MSIKDFFTVPQDEKISDRAFARVLISSICSILLCMICLAGTTWAWFISNAESPSVMSIATITMDTTLLQGEEEIHAAEDGSYTLPVGAYVLQMDVENDVAETVPTVYVLMTVTQDGAESTYYRAFSVTDRTAAIAITVEGTPVTLRLNTRWALPAAEPLGDSLTFIGEDTTTTTESTSPTETTTSVTEESTLPTEE